jgi:hypothetical protein
VTELSRLRTRAGQKKNKEIKLGTAIHRTIVQPGHFWRRIQTPSNMFQKLAHLLESLEGEKIVNGD